MKKRRRGEGPVLYYTACRFQVYGLPDKKPLDGDFQGLLG